MEQPYIAPVTTQTRPADRFLSAHLEVQHFLQHLDHLAHGTEDVIEAELHAVRIRLLALAPELSCSGDNELPAEVRSDEAERYVAGLKALRGRLERLRATMLARRYQLERARRQIRSLEGFKAAFQKTL